MNPAWLPWIFGVLGLIFGSFFNVLIYRVPRQMPITWPPSHCPECGHAIRPWHNIPVLGWLWLRGRCADCRTLIPIRYVIVEILCGLLGMSGAILAGIGEETVAWDRVLILFWLLTTLVPITVIDYEHQLIPDTISLGGIAVGVAASLFPGGLNWSESVLGALIAGGTLFGFGWIMGKLLRRDALGLGDVKLLAGFGAMMGAGQAIAAVVAASFLALLIVIPWRWWRRADSAEPLPFGPFIAFMGPVFYLRGDALIAWYWNLFR